MYLVKRGRPSSSVVIARASEGLSAVKARKTDELTRRKLPAGVVLPNSSVKNRGLTEFIESQQGMRNATVRPPGILANRSMLPS